MELLKQATTYGLIGVKVWIFKGEVLDLDEANCAYSCSYSH